MDSAYDVALNNANARDAIIVNTLGNLGGEALGRGLKAGFDRLWAKPKVVAPRAVKPLTQAQEAAIRKINNIEKGHLKPHDYTGTIRDMTGNPVPKPSGGYWDHAQEMANSLRGLRKHAKTLEGATDPAGIAARERALELIKGIEELIQGAGL